MRPVELHHGAASDVGRVRQVNEDAFLVAPPVFVVADGMGGHDRGDVASRIVVEEFARLVEEGYDEARGTDAVAGTLRRCQERIAAFDEEQRAAGSPDFSAGTTAVAAWCRS
jgi:serine/threonine protein phosphatase PrpC